MDEIEIMREQLESMKRQLDTQQIVNKELLSKILKGKASWLNKLVKTETVALPFIYLLLVCFSDLLGISQWYAFVYLIFTGVDIAFDWRVVRIPSRMFSMSSIIDLKKYILKQKKERLIQVCIALPLSIIWLVFFINEVFVNTCDPLDLEAIESAKKCIVVNSVIGGLVGIVSVIIIYVKIQRINDALLRDINTLETDIM